VAFVLAQFSLAPGTVLSGFLASLEGQEIFPQRERVKKQLASGLSRQLEPILTSTMNKLQKSVIMEKNQEIWS